MNNEPNVQQLYEEWLIQDDLDIECEEIFKQQFTSAFAGSSIYSPAAMFMAFEAGFKAGKDHYSNQLPITQMSALLDKFERLVLMERSLHVRICDPLDEYKPRFSPGCK